MRPWLQLGSFTLCLALATAQGKPEPSPAPPKRPGTEHTYRGNCSEATSRELFTACDADGDDRLDLFELHDALDVMRNLRDASGFASLDKDRDGYISWPEFDANLRSTLLHERKFRVRTIRRFVQSAPEPKPATALQQFLQLHDSNGNGGLDQAEIEAYLRRTNLPPALGSQMRTLDLDGSGRVDEAELAPWFEQLPGQNALAKLLTKESGLMPPWSTIDDDSSGTIDVTELARMLRRLAPTLERAAPELLRLLDKNQDAVLQPDEIPGKAPAKASTSALGPTPELLLLVRGVSGLRPADSATLGSLPPPSGPAAR